MNKHIWFLTGIGMLAGCLLGTAQAQFVITPIAAAENGGNMGQGRDPDKAIDRSGLNDSGTRGVELDDTHDGVRANQWGASWASNRTFTLTLPGALTVDRVHLWNAVETSSRGVQSCDFSFSTDGGSTYTNTTRIGFAQGGNTAQTQAFALHTGVTHIQLSQFLTYDGNVFINIPEIRFGAPAPVGQMHWIDWRDSSITTNSAQLSAVLGGTNADVSVYWAVGTVTNPASHVGWGGTNGPAAEATGAIARVASGLSEDTRYTYAFYATNQTFGTDAWSDPGTFVTPLAQAQAPVFTSAVPDIAYIDLSWQDNAVNETSYILRRSTNSSSGPYTTINVGNTTIYTDAGVNPGTRYYYALAATNSNNGSATSFLRAQTNLTTLALVGDVIAEYLFDGSFDSSDTHSGTTASDVSANGHTALNTAGYYDAESDEVGGYVGDDYLAFRITVDVGRYVSLSAVDWHYGAHSAFQFESGIFCDAYEGFGASGAVIPGTYTYAHGVSIDITQTRKVADLSAYPQFQDLTGTSVVFRIYMGDGASFGNRFHRYDTIRVYATQNRFPAGLIFSVR